MSYRNVMERIHGYRPVTLEGWWTLLFFRDSRCLGEQVEVPEHTQRCAPDYRRGKEVFGILQTKGPVTKYLGPRLSIEGKVPEIKENES